MEDDIGTAVGRLTPGEHYRISTKPLDAEIQKIRPEQSVMTKEIINGEEQTFITIGPLRFRYDKALGGGTYGSVCEGVITRPDKQPGIKIVVKIPMAPSSRISDDFATEIYISSLMSVEGFCLQNGVCMHSVIKTRLPAIKPKPLEASDVKKITRSAGEYYLMIYERLDGDLEALYKNYLPKFNIQSIYGHERIRCIQIALYIGIYMLYDISLMHDKRIYNRDLKPANFLYKFDDQQRLRIKISDYGLACGDTTSTKFTTLLDDKWKKKYNIKPESGIFGCYITGTALYLPYESRVRTLEGTTAVPYFSYHRYNDIFAALVTFMQSLVAMGLFGSDRNIYNRKCMDDIYPIKDYVGRLVYPFKYGGKLGILRTAEFYEEAAVKTLMKTPVLNELFMRIRHFMTVLKPTSSNYDEIGTEFEGLLTSFCKAGDAFCVTPEDVSSVLKSTEKSTVKLNFKLFK